MAFYKSEVAQMIISVITISLAFSLGFLLSFPLILLTVGLAAPSAWAPVSARNELAAPRLGLAQQPMSGLISA